MFANIRNGQISKRNFIFQKRKKVCEAFLKILWHEGFILGYTIIDSLNGKLLKIFLKYKNNQPVINSIKLISKPSKRIYYSAKQIWKLDTSSKTLIIISTNKGLKSLFECKKLKIGGEPYITVN